MKADQDQYDFLIEVYRKISSPAPKPVSVVSLASSADSTALNSKGKLAAETSIQTPVAMSEYRINFKDIQFSVVKGRLKAETHIFRIVASDTAISFLSFADSSSRAEIQIASCVLTDLSSSKSAFANIISCSHKETQMTITYVQPRTGSSRMVLIWESAILVWDIQFLLGVSNYFSRPWLVPVPGQKPSNYTPSYQFHFMNPEVIMLENKTDPMSEAVVSRAKSFVLTLDALLSITVTDMNMSLTSMHVREGVDIKLSDSFGWSLTIDSQSVDPSTSRTHILLELSPVTVYLAFTDVSIVWNILYVNIFPKTSSDGSHPDEHIVADLKMAQLVSIPQFVLE